MLARLEWRFRRPNTPRLSRQEPRVSTIVPAVLGGILAFWLVYRHLLRPDWLVSASPLLLELIGLLQSAAVLTVAFLLAMVMWRAWRHSNTAGHSMTIADLYALSPGAFERFVADLFRKKGYKVAVRGRSGDHGVDLEITRDEMRWAIVQCKRYRNPIGPDIVRELFGTMIHEHAQHAFLVTTAEITPAARGWASNKPMTLIDGRTLLQIADSLNGAG
jgi:restriction system protein